MKILVLITILFSRLGAQETIKIDFMYSNNTNGYLRACDCGDIPSGGLDKRKTIFDEWRSKNKNLIVFDAGDIIGQFGFNRSADSMTALLYRDLNYDALTPGDNEWVHGFSFFQKNLSPLPFVSANLAKNGTRIFPNYKVILRHGIRIAVIGYTPRISFTHFPKNRPLEIEIDSDETLKSAIEEVQSQSDMIIVLSHAGYENDVPLAKKFPEIDLIFGAHSQMEIDGPVKVGKTWIVQAGGNGTKIGFMEVVWKNEILRISNRLIPLDQNVKPDWEFARRIDLIVH